MKELTEKQGKCPKCGWLNLLFRPKPRPELNEVLWCCQKCDYVFKIHKLSSIVNKINEEII